MKIKDLKEQLNKLPPEADEFDAIMQKDSEGNGFSPLYALSPGKYTPNNGWSGDVDDPDDDSEMNCIVLHPSN